MIGTCWMGRVAAPTWCTPLPEQRILRVRVCASGRYARVTRASFAPWITWRISPTGPGRGRGRGCGGDAGGRGRTFLLRSRQLPSRAGVGRRRHTRGDATDAACPWRAARDVRVDKSVELDARAVAWGRRTDCGRGARATRSVAKQYEEHGDCRARCRGAFSDVFRGGAEGKLRTVRRLKGLLAK